MSDWYYGAVAESHGPVSPEEVRRLLAMGGITPETQVWCPGDGVAPTPLKETTLGGPSAETSPTRWHYEKSGSRVGPVGEVEMRRLLSSGAITRDTLVWNPETGAQFVRLGDTRLSPPMEEPPALPASAVDNSLAWVLVVIPLASAIIERIPGGPLRSNWGWVLSVIIFTLVISVIDGRRVIRSGVSDKSIRLGLWIWFVPVYLYQRARALKGPKHYFWAWMISSILSFFIGLGDLTSLINGDTYLGTGVPACDSSFEQKQVRKIFDSMDQVRSAGLTSTAMTSVHELGKAGDLRTCAAQIGANNSTSYNVVYTVEKRNEQILTNIELR